MNRTRVLVVAAVIVTAAAASWGWLRPRPVELVAALGGPLQQTLIFSGRVATPQRVDLGATITGRVAAVQVREGVHVVAGQPLVELEADEAGAAHAQAQAALQLANEQLAAQQRIAMPSSQAALAQAQANLDAAVRDRQRTQQLFDTGYVSAARLDESHRAVDVARAQQQVAQIAAQAQRAGGNESVQALLRVRQAQASLVAAQARLAQTVIAAPAAGLIVQRDVEPGQIVQPGRALLKLAADGPTQLVAQADEKFLSLLAPGQTARVVADAFASDPFEAQLASIAPAVDPQRGTVEVKLIAKSPPPFLREDMTLSLEVEVARKDDAVTLPASAVLGAGQHARVLPGA
ncbi:MAG TPA: efflux RND transporter periplasmic adaptor subunit, partial [Burkholderiaceae bacterium]|nr:efflux RND transporter periplasmic adaptor subunit [Burkholderiaceae bacterium]